MTKNNRISGKDLRKSLNIVILAVTFGNIFFVGIGSPIGGAAFTKFAIELGLDNFKYGILMAFAIFGTIIQIFFSSLIENAPRRKTIFLIAGLTHRLLWIPIALIPLLFSLKHSGIIFWTISILITISSAANSVTGVSFLSWMGNLVPVRIRGRYFSKRMMIYTFSGAIGGIGIGLFIDREPGLASFAILFTLLAVFGAMDILCFIWVKEYPIELRAAKPPLLKSIMLPLKDPNYFRFILTVSLWNFGVNFIAPFINFYMIKSLNMHMLSIYVLCQCISNISTILSVRFWGKIIDRNGNKPVAFVTCLVVSIIPLIWCLATPTNYFLVVPLQSMISGIFWPGFEMTFLNLSIWLAPEKNRPTYIANYTMFTSIIGIGLSFLIGSYIMKFIEPVINNINLPFVLGQTFSSYHAVFLLATIIRLSTLFFIPKIREENSNTVLIMLKNIFNNSKTKNKKALNVPLNSKRN